MILTITMNRNDTPSPINSLHLIRNLIYRHFYSNKKMTFLHTKLIQTFLHSYKINFFKALNLLSEIK
jgi:hypothetical protein